MKSVTSGHYWGCSGGIGGSEVFWETDDSLRDIFGARVFGFLEVGSVFFVDWK